MNKRGLLIVVSGPSGVGKGTVLKKLLADNSDIVPSISATTRAPRNGDIEGKTYFFKSVDEFKKMIDNNEFMEWAVYNDNYYGTPVKYVNEKLDEGKDVAYLTLGDPTIYSTYIYIQRIIKESGYEAEIINGIPSFCAVAAKLGDSLADRSEQLHIIPSSYDIEEALELPGNKILMKAASKLSDVKKILRDHELEAQMIENCGMEEERIYQNIDEMPEKAAYYTTLLVKK